LKVFYYENYFIRRLDDVHLSLEIKEFLKDLEKKGKANSSEN
jgi:hypothetical protein